MHIGRLAGSFVLVLAVFIPLSSSADVDTLVLPADTGWRALIASAVSGGGGPDRTVSRLEILRQPGAECLDGTLPGGVVDFVAAGVFERAGRKQDAVVRYRAALSSPLADYASFRMGNLLDSMGDAAGARAAWGSVSAVSRMWGQARLRLSSSLLAENRPDAAVAVLADMLHDELGSAELDSTRLMMASALKESGSVVEAVAVASVVWYSGSSSSGRAEAFLKDAGFPVRPVHLEMRRFDRAGGRDLRSLCRRLAANRSRHLSMDPGLHDALGSVCAARRNRDPDKAAALAGQAFSMAKDPALRAWSVRLAADALVDAGEDASAAARFLDLVRDYPSSPFSALAAYDGARAFMRVGDHDSAIRILDIAGETVPESGLSRNVGWARALAALMAGRDGEALEALDGILAARDRGRGVMFGLAERARYFRGAVLYRLGRHAEAVKDLERVARGSCCSWYGVLAASRLRDWFGATDQAVASMPLGAGISRAWSSSKVVDVQRPPVRVGGASDPGAWLYLIGEEKAAAAELSTRAARCMLDEGGLELLAFLKEDRVAAGKARTAALSLRGRPDGQSVDIWAAAWPRPWYDGVTHASTLFDIAPALIYAVMRVESGFNPSARSAAGARGLMQVMPRTSKVITKKVLEPIGVKKTSGPLGNILTGTALLDQLCTHFDGNLPLVLAGYNAGSGAARSFLRRLRHFETDLLVEAIPYGRTREYIRKVGGHMAAYRYLYGNSVPFRVSFEVPAVTGPFLDRDSARNGESAVMVRGGPGRAGSGLRLPRL